MPDPTQANVSFRRAMQKEHSLLKEGSPDNRLIIVIDLTVKVGERSYSDLRVEISQPYGTHFKESFEVRPIEGYTGPTLNRDQFVQMCEDYYRKMVGPTGVIRANTVIMKNNWFLFPMERTIDLQKPSSGAW
jgi:hypothetical protein